jgi:hypothetical protein
MRAAQVIGVVIALAIAGCGGSEPAARSTGQIDEIKATQTDKTQEWVDQANEACRSAVPDIERAGKPLPRAMARAQKGAPGGWDTVAKHMKRQSQAITSLYKELKAIPKPEDERIRKFLYQYANVAGGSFRAVDAMLYDRRTAADYVADANEAGRDAHEIATDLGTEACTSWLVE